MKLLHDLERKAAESQARFEYRVLWRAFKSGVTAIAVSLVLQKDFFSSYQYLGTVVHLLLVTVVAAVVLVFALNCTQAFRRDMRPRKQT